MRVSGHGFTDNLWGKRARALVKSAQRLKDSNWEQIQEHTLVHVQRSEHDLDNENGEGSGGVDVDALNPYTEIDINWWVIKLLIR